MLHIYSLLILLYVAYLASRYFHHGLYKYPGPFWANFSNLWRLFDVLGRRPEVTHLRLHRKYGDIVRLGPNALSFGDPKAVKEIYGVNKGYVKVYCEYFEKRRPMADLFSSLSSILFRCPSLRASRSHLSFLPRTKSSMQACAAWSTMPSP